MTGSAAIAGTKPREPFRGGHALLAGGGGAGPIGPNLAKMPLIVIVLPMAISASRRAVEHLLRPPDSSQIVGPPGVIEATLEHAIRTLLIIGAVAVLAWGWDVDLVHFAGQDTSFALAARGVLTTVMILLVADELWHAAKAAIDTSSPKPLNLASRTARRRGGGRGCTPYCRFSAMCCLL